MAAKTNHLKPMSWLVMDILDLKFPDKYFDVVIDKGTIDSLMVDQGSPWEPKEEVLLDVRKALSEVWIVTYLVVIEGGGTSYARLALSI